MNRQPSLSTLETSPKSFPHPPLNFSKNSLDPCKAIAWLELIEMVKDFNTVDDWLPLCPDIDEGEIYRDWFLWYDAEINQEWEAYDPLTDDRLIAKDKTILMAKIDGIEASRNMRPKEFYQESKMHKSLPTPSD